MNEDLANVLQNGGACWMKKEKSNRACKASRSVAENQTVWFLRFRNWLGKLIEFRPGGPQLLVYERAHARGLPEALRGPQTHSRSWQQKK